jgi:glycosyltransferase involved in cell wall biosynthesis
MKILFVYSTLATYVKKDIDILKSRHTVKEMQFPRFRYISTLYKEVRWCDISIAWFGYVQAFFAVLFSKLLGKKSIVIAGGWDVAKEPEIGYGIFTSWKRKWYPLFSFKFADLILAVSNFTRLECIHNARASHNKITVVYHGFMTDDSCEVDYSSKEKLVITVCLSIQKNTIITKGLELFVRSARYLPEVKFLLIASDSGDGSFSYLKEIASKNITFTGCLYGEDLINLYKKARVYVQVSYRESFGCSLAEAMLYGCVPVVSRRAAIPEVVGDCGIYVDKLEPEEVALKIKQALHSDLGKKASERIKMIFPLEKRRKELLGAVASLIHIENKCE